MTKTDEILRIVRSSGVTNAVAIDGKDVVYDRMFREMCERNSCGRYGKYYVCPPDAGDIDTLIAKAGQFTQAVLYQTISGLEDSYDIEGMMEASKLNHACAQKIQSALLDAGFTGFLHLSSGGCDLCERCGKADNIPCRHPEKALSNMESYGIYVAKTAENAGLKYINGANTITYFGIVLY